MSEIEIKYNAVKGFYPQIGNPTINESVCPDGRGRFRHYDGGSIYWSGRPGTKAFLIYGQIKAKWAALGWEQSSLGYPLTDESGSACIRFNHFDGGSIYYTPAAGVKVVTTANKIKAQNFLPSVSGLHFSNSYSHVPDLIVPVAGQPITFGDAANGLCGGMCYTVRDYFESHIAVPPDTQSPTGGVLFKYMVRRLFDSFNGVPGIVKYLHLMDPAFPDLEPKPGIFSITSHSRAWVMIREEWPRIKSDLDSGKLSPMALVLTKSADPFQMGHNHQVVAYGYSLVGTDLIINLYDPNYPNDDNCVLYLNITSPQQSVMIASSSCYPVNCFFRTDYTFVSPPTPQDLQPPVVTGKSVSVTNNTTTNCTVRFYEPTATSFPLALTLYDGTRLVPAGNTILWNLPAKRTSIKLTINGRNAQTVNGGGAVIFNTDERVTIANAVNRDVTVRIYNAGEPIHVRDITLQDGLKQLPPNQSIKWLMPDDITQLKVSFDDDDFQLVSRGQTITHSKDSRVTIHNDSNHTARFLIFNAHPVIASLIATLPGGDFTINKGEQSVYTVPADISEVEIRADIKNAMIGDNRNNAAHINVAKGGSARYRTDGTITIG